MKGRLIGLRLPKAIGRTPTTPDEAPRKKGGRPRQPPTGTISARLPQTVLDEFNAVLERRGITCQAFLTETVQKLLAAERRATKGPGNTAVKAEQS